MPLKKKLISFGYKEGGRGGVVYNNYIYAYFVFQCDISCSPNCVENTRNIVYMEQNVPSDFNK